MALKKRVVTGSVGGTESHCSEIWELKNIPTGAKTIAWTANDANATVYGESFSWQDVDQTTPTGTVSFLENDNSAAPIVTSIDCVTNDLVIGWLAHASSGLTVTDNSSGGQSRIATYGFGSTVAMSARSAGTGSGISFGYTLDFSDNNSIIAFALKSVSAGGGVFIPIIGRGPGMALAGRGGLVGRSAYVSR